MNFRILFLIINLVAMSQAKNYYLFQVRKLNWHSAYLDCLSRGLQLATITSEEEQAQIVAVINKAKLPHFWFWLGGTDLGHEGSFVWMPTGKAIAYSKWSPGQPDNANNVEHCMHTWPFPSREDISWNDLNCKDTLTYICEDQPECEGDAK